MELLKDDTRFAALECDLQAEYGVDLLDLWRGRISLRKLLTLVHGLRYGSRKDQDWSEQIHMQADQIDLLNYLVWLTRVSLSKETKDAGNPPEPIRRPLDEEPEPEEVFFTPTDQLSSVFELK